MVSIDFNHPIDFSEIPNEWMDLEFLEDGTCKTTLPGEVEEREYNYICFSGKTSHVGYFTTYLILYNPNLYDNHPDYVGILSENPKPNVADIPVQVITKLATYNHKALQISIVNFHSRYYMLHHNKLLRKDGTVLCTTHSDIKYQQKPAYVGYLVQDCGEYIHVEMCTPSTSDSLLNGELLHENDIEDKIYKRRVELDYSSILPNSVENDSTNHFTTSSNKPVTVVVKGDYQMYVLGCPFDGDVQKLITYIYSIGRLPVDDIYIFPNGINQTIIFGESYCPYDGTTPMELDIQNKNNLDTEYAFRETRRYLENKWSRRL